jgi:hypothetical protein
MTRWTLDKAPSPPRRGDGCVARATSIPKAR